VTAFRESLGETQEQFARRLGTSVVTIARWETSQPPRSAATLERLLKLARRHRHVESARAFETALGVKGMARASRRRIAEILNPANAKLASDKLEAAWGANEHLIQEIVTSEDPDQFLLIAAEETRACLLELADLICFDGRKELIGETKK
jgi:transcriptional regulator with XRE-family HTH domain